MKQLNRRIGQPPSIDDAPDLTTRPDALVEQAAPVPVPVPVPAPAPDQPARSPRQRTTMAPAAPPPAIRLDGRTLNRTNRTVGFSTRVTSDWDLRVRQIAMARGIMMVEVLEQALAALEREIETSGM